MQVHSVGWDDPLEEGMATHSCLENPMDRGAWWAAVHSVTQSQTRLKQLSTAQQQNKRNTKLQEQILYDEYK